MEVQHITPPYATMLRHASRLKFYAEADNEVTRDLVDHAAYGEGGFHVESLLDARVDSGRYEVLVKWLGLEESEVSWEPAIHLYEDIPVVLCRWIVSKEGSEPIVRELRDNLEKTLGHPL
ncbi:hypothetical protein AC1031_012265 [Aphanomyces cochlioides]|nr:hypothetical protein AC1031_012265 [Aphanomyces cochlioides]